LRQQGDAEENLPQAPWSESHYDESAPRAASVGRGLAVVSVAAGAVLAAIAITIFLFMGG
jgi:hypothetical protein